MAKKFFKCKVCGDIHYGEKGPEICSTCQQENSYEEITLEEARERLGF